MAVQKTLLREDKTAVVKCPECRRVKTIPVYKLKQVKKHLKIKCSCECVFPIELEFRNIRRKETRLRGTYLNYADPKDRKLMVVKDVSMNGIGFNPLVRHNLQPDDRIRVEFELDDRNATIIKRDAVVKLVKGEFIGCEFIGFDEYDSDLGNFISS